MARRINDIDLIALPLGCHSCRNDRDAAFALLLHPIGNRSTIIHGTNPMGHACIEQDSLSGSRFTGINMSNDADVSIPFERERTCHKNTCLVRFKNR